MARLVRMQVGSQIISFFSIQVQIRYVICMFELWQTHPVLNPTGQNSVCSQFTKTHPTMSDTTDQAKERPPNYE